ncbi:MAG: hypothetical protein OEN01_02005, partial [Candidatus Krumholzibacteria bacterium]|nr:hypothetical protein [Candidatus Krumholzibacteria bacterium]
MQTATTGLPVSPENSRSRQVEFLTIGGIVFVGLLLRLPLWMAPGPGRDEAAYHYWVHHPEPVFAPLLQAAVRCFEFIGSCSLWSLRGPVVLLGVVALMLNDRRLREAGASLNSRRLALATLAFTPWQSFAGSILHPDNFFLVGMLVLVIAVQRKQILLSAVVASSMVLAKPTGLLMLPVVWWLAGRLGTSPARPSAPSLRWRVTTSRLMLLSTLVAFVLLMDRSMLDGIANFGRMAGVVPLASRLSAWSLALVFLGGPLLLVLSIPGIRQRWTIMRHRGQSEARREAEAALAIAGIVLVFFISAAIFRDQFKANWVLPAFVLLWPIRLPRWPRSVLAVGLVLTVMGSVGQSIVFLQSGMGGSAKAVLTGIESVSNYELHASVREAKVSSSLTWHHRAAEYGDV